MQLCVSACERVFTYHTVDGDPSSSHQVDTMVLSIATALKNMFPAVPLT